MKILIIGSKGFIGSHCVNFFSEKYETWQSDVVVDYTTPNYVLLDATNANYEELFSQTNFDVCINCSGAASVPESINNPQRDFTLNTFSVFKQLDAIRKKSPKCKYIHLSSAAVYGNPNVLPISESHPLSPISPYGRHKKMAEEICQEFYIQYGIQSCSLRIFSAYGPGLKKQLFWDLYKKHKESSEIKLYGTGQESRDFIYITDLVEVFDIVIHNGSFNADTINVANGKELTIEKVADTFYNNIDSNINISFGGQKRDGDPSNWLADIKKLQKLGYNQKVSIEEGLINYIGWLKGLE